MGGGNASPTNNKNHGWPSIKLNNKKNNKQPFRLLRILVLPHQKVLLTFGSGKRCVALPALGDSSGREVLRRSLSCPSPKRQRGRLPALSLAPCMLRQLDESIPTSSAPLTQGHTEGIFGATRRCGQRWGIKLQSEKCRRPGYIRPLRMTDRDLEAGERQGGCGVWLPLPFPSWRKAEWSPVPICPGSTSLPVPSTQLNPPSVPVENSLLLQCWPCRSLFGFTLLKNKVKGIFSSWSVPTLKVWPCISGRKAELRLFSI